jgi:hypothetical protein
VPPITPTDDEVPLADLELRVTPLLGETPIGAPVRVKLELVNNGGEIIDTPATLSLKSEFVRGWVTDPSGVARSFSTLMRCIEEHPMRQLAPGDSVEHDLTLLRGGQGALFPAGGLYTITAEVSWDLGDARAVVRGETTLLVTGVQGAAHAAAAHKVLATPDAHLVLVLGGDHLPEGVEAIQEAVANDVLAPHYAVIEAKRIAGLQRRGGNHAHAPASVERLVDENSVMSASEVAKLAKLVKMSCKDAARGGVRRVLKQQLERRKFSGDAVAEVDSL